MFSVRNILYCNDFQFGNSAPKNRYLIILHKDADEIVILSAITSQKYVPSSGYNSGCNNLPEKSISFYHFPKGQEVGERGFKFPKDSFIYSSYNVFDRDSTEIESLKTNNVINIKDKLLEDQYFDLVYCLYKSDKTKRGIKRKFEKVLEMMP